MKGARRVNERIEKGEGDEMGEREKGARRGWVKGRGFRWKRG